MNNNIKKERSIFGSDKSVLGKLQETAKLMTESKTMTVEKITTIEEATAFIKYNDSQMTNSWFNMCHALKKVRDEKLYKDKYNTFQEYHEADLNYQKAMVYNFIKIAEEFPFNIKHKVLELGVTKLLALSEINQDIREQFIEENIEEIKQMSISETKEKIKQAINAKKAFETEVSFTPNEYKDIHKFHNKLSEFHKTFENFIVEQDTKTPVNHDKITQLNQELNEAKIEMKRIERVIKRYL